MFKLSSRSKEKLKGVNSELIRVVLRAIEITTVDFAVVQGVRTQAEQDALYEQGRTKPGPIVTWTRNSKHIGGNAVDLAAFVNGSISWSPQYYDDIALAMKQAARELGVKIGWGPDLGIKGDLGHYELIKKEAK